ncbi:MAG: hypothetical protein NWQ24_02050 [Haliea sp.]|nr:hypothetical protein [Haliea sp.]
MTPPLSNAKQTPIADLIIRLGLAAILAWLALRVFAPFLAMLGASFTDERLNTYRALMMGVSIAALSRAFSEAMHEPFTSRD